MIQTRKLPRVFVFVYEFPRKYGVSPDNMNFAKSYELGIELLQLILDL